MQEKRYDDIMYNFRYKHLPSHLQEVSKPFCKMAVHVHNTLPRNAERTTALRKILEAKDAAVRAAIPTVEGWEDELDALQEESDRAATEGK